MKPLKTAVCAIALMLGCLPLTACSGRSDDSANKENFEQVEEGGEVVTLPGDIQIPEPEIPQEPQTPQAQYILVRTNGLNVRSGAGTSSEILGTVENGVLLQYVGTAGGWYETRYKGRTAYVSADTRYTSLTSMEAGSEKIESVIQEGLNVLGTPYVY
ncbi:MAG: SH3 domain-containing protein, partial [Clostridia bacterium]|nr:SH3 domain-containing protein [Clostridia bacterium]